MQILIDNPITFSSKAAEKTLGLVSLPGGAVDLQGNGSGGTAFLPEKSLFKMLVI